MADVLSTLIDKGVRDSFFKGLSLQGGGVHISHLPFADDTLLFFDHDFPMLENMKNRISGFVGLSSLKINLSKSRLVGTNI